MYIYNINTLYMNISILYIYIYILYKDGKPKKTTILLSNSSGTDLAPGRGRQCSIPTEWPQCRAGRPAADVTSAAGRPARHCGSAEAKLTPAAAPETTVAQS